ncbi:hypothetical protein AGMMS49975_11570 [Clostridia bacterium]|nr:hypothetical protein AGMMS49975_11570 [Clostridia bacterium]
MKEAIYTIPVTEAFEAGGECPFCEMRERLEREALEFVLGASYMESNIRAQTDKQGFCAEHSGKMHAGKNALGVALMTHTHLKAVSFQLNKLLYDLSKSKPSFGKKTRAEKVISYIKNHKESCYLCNRVDKFFERYISTFFDMWKNNKINDKVANGEGFCLNHYAELLEYGEKNLTNSEFDDFVRATVPIQLKAFARLDGELDWLIQKYDYRFKDEPWKTSKDALPRSLKKLQSVRIKE